MAFLILLALIVLNGVFAMSELAVVSARKARLQAQAEEGDAGAKQALALVESPNNFLSTVQVGITLIAIISGAFGGTQLAAEVTPILRQALPFVGDAADDISIALVIALTTYLSLVIGELAPKRIALLYAEPIARFIARPMTLLSRIATPLVWLLSQSTSLVLRILGMNNQDAPSITEREIITLVREGRTSGVIEESEREMVEAVFRLDDQRIGSLITPRGEIICLRLTDTDADIRAKMDDRIYSVYPVCGDNGLDDVLGMVRAKDILASLCSAIELNIQALIREPLFIPETVPTSEVLRRFKETGVHTALIISEYGGVEGLVTLHDIIEAIVGDVDAATASEADRDAVERPDGSWLLDGTLSIYRLRDLFPQLEIPQEDTSQYDTLAGLILTRLQHVPSVSEVLEWQGFSFEVVDMDGRRIDKVLVRALDERNMTVD